MTKEDLGFTRLNMYCSLNNDVSQFAITLQRELTAQPVHFIRNLLAIPQEWRNLD